VGVGNLQSLKVLKTERHEYDDQYFDSLPDWATVGCIFRRIGVKIKVHVDYICYLNANEESFATATRIFKSSRRLRSLHAALFMFCSQPLASLPSSLESVELRHGYYHDNEKMPNLLHPGSLIALRLYTLNSSAFLFQWTCALQLRVL